MSDLQTYGVVSNRFSDTEYRDIEPVDDKFIGVSYYVAEDVDYAMSRLKDSIAQSMKQTDELIAMVDGLLS